MITTVINGNRTHHFTTVGFDSSNCSTRSAHSGGGNDIDPLHDGFESSSVRSARERHRDQTSTRSNQQLRQPHGPGPSPNFLPTVL